MPRTRTEKRSRLRNRLQDTLRIGTWNVRKLQRGGAFQELLELAEKYRMELIALQEVRWSGSGIHQTNSYDLLYSAH